MTTLQEEKSLRDEIVLIAHRMDSYGLNHGTSGNISVRVTGGMLITPSSIPAIEIKPFDIIKIDSDGRCINNSCQQQLNQPSSEWKLHSKIFERRQEVNAIIHCHSVNATALACHAKSIPSFHYMTAVGGGHNIRCAEYATFGSSELSEHAIKALENRFVCLLAQHGQVTIEKNLEKALKLAIEVENLSNIYIKACILGEPKLISKAEMSKVLTKFKSLNYLNQEIV